MRRRAALVLITAAWASGCADEGSPPPSGDVPDTAGIIADAITSSGGGVAVRCDASRPCACAAGATCTLECPAGGCTFECRLGSACETSCPGGRCTTTCGPRSSCGTRCAGGACTTVCSASATCDADCEGGDCALSCAAGASCLQSCSARCSLECGEDDERCAQICGSTGECRVATAR